MPADWIEELRRAREESREAPGFRANDGHEVGGVTLASAAS